MIAGYCERDAATQPGSLTEKIDLGANSDTDGLSAHQGSERRQKDYSWRRSQVECSRPADNSVYRRRRHRPRYMARVAIRLRQRGQESLRRQEKNRVDGSLRGREAVQGLEGVAARRNRRGV